jgi:xanthosine utilization system XapX-like protein
MKLLYKPFGLIVGIIGGLLGKRLFDFVWTKIDDEEPPEATTKETQVGKIIAAAALQGAIFKTTRAVIDRQGAKGWYYLTGSWPGEKRPDPDE